MGTFVVILISYVVISCIIAFVCGYNNLGEGEAAAITFVWPIWILFIPFGMFFGLAWLFYEAGAYQRYKNE